jgi:hypothetical protein
VIEIPTLATWRWDFLKSHFMKSDRIVCNTEANELIVHIAPKTIMVFMALFLITLSGLAGGSAGAEIAKN